MARTVPSFSMTTIAACLALYCGPYCRSMFSVTFSAWRCKFGSRPVRTMNTRSVTLFGNVLTSLRMSSNAQSR